MTLWIREKEQARIAEEALELMERGFKMGRKLYVERRELHR